MVKLVQEMKWKVMKDLKEICLCKGLCMYVIIRLCVYIGVESWMSSRSIKKSRLFQQGPI